MSSVRILIKLGGASLQDENIIASTVETLRQYRRFGFEVILVHGGGPAINRELTQKGMTWSFVQGQRVTTPEMMDSIEMVLCGLINRKIVRALNAAGIPAVGFSGADHKTLLCEQASPQLGQVGAITQVNTAYLEHVLAMPGKPIPVIAPLGVGQNGEAYNINADKAACQIASALQAHQLIFLTDQSGLLDQEKNLVRSVDIQSLEEFIDSEVVTGGMLAKTQAVIEALQNQVSSVRILNAKDSLHGLWSDQIGTQCFSHLPRVTPPTEKGFRHAYI